MYLYKEIKLTPFPITLHTYIGKDVKIFEDIQKDFDYNLLSGFNMEITKGICSYDTDLNGNYIIWVMCKKYLLHEIVHCVDALMQNIEVESMEFRAYYVDYLFNYLKNDKIYKKNHCKQGV